MRDIFKSIGLLLIGLLVSIVVYPFLHETGHWIMAVVVGANVVDYRLFPIPYVMCDIANINDYGVALIGVGGLWFPAIIAFFIRPKAFLLWYGLFTLKGICILSFIISLFSIAFLNFGAVSDLEDIVTVAKACDDIAVACAVVMLLVVIASIYAVIYQNPMKKIMKYFNITPDNGVT